jgi:hypothetical protein
MQSGAVFSSEFCLLTAKDAKIAKIVFVPVRVFRGSENQSFSLCLRVTAEVDQQAKPLLSLTGQVPQSKFPFKTLLKFFFSAFRVFRGSFTCRTSRDGSHLLNAGSACAEIRSIFY